MYSPGKALRMNRLMEGGRTIIAAMDHTRYLGPVQGTRTEAELKSFVAQANRMGVRGVITTPLNLRTTVNEIGNMVALLSVAGGTTPFTIADARTEIDVDLRDVVRSGADGIYFWAVTHRDGEREHLRMISRLATRCRDYGLPLVVEAMTNELFLRMFCEDTERRAINTKDLCAACRVIAEMGVDIVKTYYPGDVNLLREIVETCLVPVIIAGGPAVRTDVELIEMVRNSMEAGAAGVAFGRSFFQHADPGKIMNEIYEIVFGKTREG